MRAELYIVASVIVGLFSCSNTQTIPTSHKEQADSIVKIEMNLSAFGLESADFPSIDVLIDFSKDTNVCVKTFDNPSIKGSKYSLTKKEMQSILKLLKITDLEKLNREYKINLSDQPRSITKIHTTQKAFVIDDYGLKGEYPLQELYKIVYKY